MQNPTDYLEGFDVDPTVKKCERCGKDMQYTNKGVIYCSCWMPRVELEIEELIAKPEPSQYYDIDEVTDYMNKKYGYTDKDWDEILEKFTDYIQSHGTMLVFDKKNDNELEHKVVDEFCDDDSEEVQIYYWW